MKSKFATVLTAALLAASAWAQPPAPAPNGPIDDGPAVPVNGDDQQNGPESRPLPNMRVQGPQSQITLPAGSWIKIRVDQPLSSDRNRQGDGFGGTLAQPVIADGFVIAHRGQTVEGRVTEAVKAGRAKGTSKLAFEITEIGLADGQQLPVRTEMIQYNGDTSVGRDVAAVGATTGVGAAIGGAAAGGMGAGLGAIAGAVASGIGVAATRGRAAEVYPETVVTFRTLAPITISTERAPHAFQPVQQTDYERRSLEQRPARQVRPSLNYGGYNPYFYGGPSFWYGPGYWGPSFYGGGYYGYGPRIVIRGGGGGYRRR